MSSLSGQSIQSTYQGLLKLSNSTTGITTSFQNIEDGLGNNTGSRIGTNIFSAPNVAQSYMANFKVDHMGNGAQNASAGSLGAVQNAYTFFGYFYDPGVYSYSSITMNVSQVTTTTDTVNMYFYDLQWVNFYGFYPKTLVMSGITLNTSPLGFFTVNLPSHLSFSGTGGGYYAYALHVTNSGVTPTVRYTTPIITPVVNSSLATYFGFCRNNAGTTYGIANRINNISVMNWLNGVPKESYSSSDITSQFTTNQSNAQGFLLNVVR